MEYAESFDTYKSHDGKNNKNVYFKNKNYLTQTPEIHLKYFDQISVNIIDRFVVLGLIV